MLFKDWTKNIDEIISEIADEAYQKEVRLNKSDSRTSSFTEAICALYDDFCFDDFMEELESESAPVALEVEKFKYALDACLENVQPLEIDSQIISRADWMNIRLLASNASKALKSLVGKNNS